MARIHPFSRYSGHLQQALRAVSRGLDDRGLGVVEVLEYLARFDHKPTDEAIVKICDVIYRLVRGTFVHDKRKENWTLVTNKYRTITDGEFECISREHEDLELSLDEFDLGSVLMGAYNGQYDAEWLFENQHLIPEEERGFVLVFTGTKWETPTGKILFPALFYDETNRWGLQFIQYSSKDVDEYRLVRALALP